MAATLSSYQHRYSALLRKLSIGALPEGLQDAKSASSPTMKSDGLLGTSPLPQKKLSLSHIPESSSEPPLSPSKMGSVDQLSKMDLEGGLYLDYLCSCNLSKLVREPELLKQEENSVMSELTHLAYSEYDSFLTANSCTRELRQDDFTKLSKQLHTVSSVKLDELGQSCQELNGKIQDILTEKVKYEALFDEQGKLLDLLDAPQLMETFIRNAYYEDAMELYSYIQRLLSFYPDVQLLKKIAMEIDNSNQTMLIQLVQLLQSENAKLPLCIRVVGYLRRMEAYPEPELRILFLQQRRSYLTKKLDAIKTNDAVEYLKKYFDQIRELFFDIITQYKAIFADSASSLSVGTVSAHVAKTSFLSDFSIQSSTQTILGSFVLNFITEFNQVLREHVPRLKDGQAIASVFTSANYFALSLERMGIDYYRGISHIFEQSLLTIFNSLLFKGAEEFIQWTLEDPHLLYTKSPLTETSDSNVSLHQLQLYPCLAFILNKYYTAYNQIRLVPFSALMIPCCTSVQESLTSIALRISEVAKVVPESDINNYRQVCGLFAEQLVPLLIEGLVKVFNAGHISDDHLTQSEQLIRKMDVRSILSSIAVHVAEYKSTHLTESKAISPSSAPEDKPE